ncbi:MAG: hypothetical protein ACREDM_06895 [Methylocella sp.]
MAAAQAEGLSGIFRRQAKIPRKGQGLACQASMECLTGTREEFIADQITDAMKVTGKTKTAMAARMRMG